MTWVEEVTLCQKRLEILGKGGFVMGGVERPAPLAANANTPAVPLPVLLRLVCGIIARSAGLFQNPKQICACDGVTLWEERDRPIAGKGRSKASAEVPAANL